MGKPGAAASACLQLHWNMDDVSLRCYIQHRVYLGSCSKPAASAPTRIHLSCVCVCVCVCVQSCLTLCDLTDYSLPVSSVHGILQASTLEWIATPSSRGSSPPRDGTCVSCIAGRFFTTEPPGKPPSIIPICKLPISSPTHWAGSWNAEMALKSSFLHL